MSVNVRAFLEELCTQRGEDFAGLSRMLGRNPAYIQQFIKRGSPRRLASNNSRSKFRLSHRTSN